MALLYRTNSTAKRMRKKSKKANSKPKKPKFPKNALKRKDGGPGRVSISQPFDPVLGTAHPGNRLNEIFGVDPNTLPRAETPQPHLSQWVSDTLTYIAYTCSKAHHVTKLVVFPQPAWRKIKMRLRRQEDDVLTHILRNLATDFRRVRDHYMNGDAPQIVECLEESDLLWQNILEPFTGVVQIMSEVMFRGHTNLEIHKIDGLKLARSVRMVAEELQLVSTMWNSMIGMIATRWTERTIVMALDTAQKWRSTTIKRWGLEDVYDEYAKDTEFDDVDIKKTNIFGKPKVPPRPENRQNSRQTNTPGGRARNDSPVVQTRANVEANVEASSSTHDPPALKPAPRAPRTRDPSVLLTQYQPRPEPYEETPLVRERREKERDQREYSERSAYRTMLGNLPDDDPPFTQQPTYHTRAYAAAAKNGQPHHGLQMNGQDMELDPLRLAQIRGVDNSESILSYPNFPSAHLTDNRTRPEIVPRGSDRHEKVRREKVDKGKNVERRSAMKQDKAAVIPDDSHKHDKEGLNHAEVQDRVMKLNGHIISQVKGSITVDPENRVEILVPLSRNKAGKPLTSSLSKRNKESTNSMTGAGTEEVRRPRVRFADPSPPTEEITSSRKDRESTRSRTSGEGSSSRSGSRNVGESSRSRRGEHRTSASARSSREIRSARRLSANRNGLEPSPSQSGRPFPIPLRVGNDVVPAPPMMRQTQSQSPLVKGSAGFLGDRSIMPAPLAIRQKPSKSPLDNRGVDFSNTNNLMPAPLKLGQHRSKSPLENRSIGFPEDRSALPAPLKLGHARNRSPLITSPLTKSPLENHAVGLTKGQTMAPTITNLQDVQPQTYLAPPKPGHARTKSPLANQGAGLPEGHGMAPTTPDLNHMQHQTLLAPKIGHACTESPLENHGMGLIEGQSMASATPKLYNEQSKTFLPPPKLGHARTKSPLATQGVGLPEGQSMASTTPKLNNVQPQTFLAPPKLGHKRSKSPLENRGVGTLRAHPSIMAFDDYSKSPIGPPPDRPLPPLPTDRK